VRGWVSSPYVGIATGADFPDAVGGGAVAGAMGGVLVLTRPRQLSGPARAFMGKRGEAGAPVRVFGGPPTISDAVVLELRSVPLL